MVSLQAALAALALSSAGQTVLLDFYADWCGPCRAMNPTVEALVEQGYPVQRVNIDQNRALAARYGVRDIPCFVMLVDGKEVDRVVGGTSFSRLERMCQMGATAGQSDPPLPSANNVLPPVRIPTEPHSQPPGLVVPLAHLPAQPYDPPAADQLASPVWRGAQPSEIPPVSPPSDASVETSVSDAALIAASVRLRIKDADGHSCGTGTIIDARGGEALVLTCGHIFRDSQGKGGIEVDLFGAGGPQSVPGRLISFDLTRDVGLVAIRPPGSVTTARIAPPNYRVGSGQPVVSVGCNNGQPPTARHSRVTTLDKYSGPPNIQVAGQPVVGRSGGGLFSSEGYLIGVCNAADPADKEGFFAAPATVRAELDAAKLSFIYQSPSVTPAGASASSNPMAVAAVAPPAMPKAMPGASGLAPLAPVPTSMRTASGELSPHEQSALDEIRRHLNDGAEVICIIRPRGNPEAKSEVIMLDRASLAFLEQLAAERRSRDGRQLSSPAPTGPREKLLEWSDGEGSSNRNRPSSDARDGGNSPPDSYR